MLNQPGVSIYIITYLDSEERCRVLEATCRNVLQQRYPTFEVVVSDNAGEISAEQALKSIKDPRLKIFRNEKNIGMAGNMNCCIARCKYNILKLNCDDDLLHPDSLLLSVSWVDDATLVVTDMEKFTIGTVPLGIDDPAQKVPTVVERPPGYRLDFWEIGYDALPGDTLMTKKMFTSLGGFDPESAVDDWDFAVRARLHRRIVNIKCVLCYQGVWDFSLTEQMLKNEPYYFQQAGLHTHFKILRDKSLNRVNRGHCRWMIFRELVFNSLRFLKYAAKPRYRSGYVDYLKSMLRELKRKKTDTQGI